MFLQCCVTAKDDDPREALCTDMAEYLSLPCETMPIRQGIAERLDSRSLPEAHAGPLGLQLNVQCAGSNRGVCGGKPASQPTGHAVRAAWSVKDSGYRRSARRRTGSIQTLLTQPTSVVDLCLAGSASSSVSPPRSVLCVLTARRRVLTRAVATPP